MKYGYDEITQGVRLNDAMSENQEIDEILSGFGVDPEALSRVAMARAEMSLTHLLAHMDSLNRALLIKASLGATFFDGFIAALHMVEQKSLTDPDGDATL